MKNLVTYILSAVFILTVSGVASAACYADYKAKRDKPLRLHYGVVEVSDAVCQDHKLAKKAVSDRIEKGQWELLNVLSVFGEKGLDKRKDSAGKFFLRF